MPGAAPDDTAAGGSEARAVCIIPARGGSKRLPRKNVLPLAGKPLLSYAIEAAVDSGVFAHVVVSSEDDEILAVASRHEGVEALRRDDELAGDDAQVKQVCHRVLRELAQRGEQYDVFAVLLVTNPLRTAADVRAAYDEFIAGDANYLMSLVPFSHPPQRAVHVVDGMVEPYFGHQHMKQTQRLEPLFRHDGSIVLARTGVFLEEGELYGTRVAPYFMPIERSVDIDSELDLLWAEFLLRRGDGPAGP